MDKKKNVQSSDDWGYCIAIEKNLSLCQTKMRVMLISIRWIWYASIVNHQKDFKTMTRVMHFFGMMLVLVYVPCCVGIVKQQKIRILNIKP
jgi:hypothetical protein